MQQYRKQHEENLQIVKNQLTKERDTLESKLASQKEMKKVLDNV